MIFWDRMYEKSHSPEADMNYECQHLVLKNKTNNSKFQCNPHTMTYNFID